MQGRVFSARRLIAWLTNPISPLIAGVMADQWLEPAFKNQTPFAQSFAWLVGDGPGAGMALMFVVCGAMVSLAGAVGYLFPAIRNAEDILPDAQPSV